MIAFRRRWSTMRELVKAMKSLSDETRLRMLNLLLERECCVCEVMQVLGISQSTASRGLCALYDAGFLKQRKEGTWTFYSIAKDTAHYYSEMLEAVREVLEDNSVAEADRQRLRKTKLVAPIRASHEGLAVQS
jgi:ArsR family transcriptional regulator